MDAKTSLFALSVICVCFSLQSHLSFAADRITANQSLSGDQTIVSAGGSFKLGFFKTPGNSSNYYIGIWYNRVSQQTVVWVANREIPVSDRFSSELKISDTNLVLYNESKIPIWSTSLTVPPSSPVEVVLLDIGNLVLRDGSNLSDPLWQSFDHPTDTWLPGANFGFNKITERNMILTSWKSRMDPAPGLFSIEIDLDSSSISAIWWKMTQQVLGSRPGNVRSFSSYLGMVTNDIGNFSYVNNENGSYFIYSLYYSSTISRVVIDVDGHIQQQVWQEPEQKWSSVWAQPKTRCEVYAYCGAFGSCNEELQPFCQCLRGFNPKYIDEWNSEVYSHGCVRRTSLQCENSSLDNGKSDRFFTIYTTSLPANRGGMTAGTGTKCEATCLSSCSCTAYAYDSSFCYIWYGDLLNLQKAADDDPSRRTLYVRLAASEFTSSDDRKAVGINKNERIVIGAVMGSIVMIVLISLFLCVIWRKRLAKTEVEEIKNNLLVTFKYRYLQKATKNFSEKLGGGGFGSVVKGVLPNSSVIAVKKLESISQGEKQFRAEVSIIGTIQHVNLVRLCGFCSEGNHKLLVYDYMPNGSLHSHLFHGRSSYVLNWKTRYQIALGVAKGFAYLHEKCRDCIIHCDIKPDNILLDSEFCPKVADFGLAKLYGRDFSRVLTTMRGTIGYLAPEWISGVAVTAKADVYSYGMMLFEIISGRRNSEQSNSEKGGYFPLQAANVLHEDGDVLGLLDPRLDGNGDVEEITRICKVACWCIQYEETQRPTMGLIVHILEGVLDMNLPPIPRFLQVLGEDVSSAQFSV